MPKKIMMESVLGLLPEHQRKPSPPGGSSWQTERFLELETHRDGHVVVVRPEQVVEIAFDGVQRSSRYPGGLALRFARVKGYRPDKSAQDADTIHSVRAIFERSRGRPERANPQEDKETAT